MYLASVLLHDVHFFMKQKQSTIRKMNFLIIFSQWQNHIAILIRFPVRSKILLFGVVKIPLQKDTE